MSFVATVSAFDLLFLLSTGLLLVASVAYRRDRTGLARALAVNGWFWLGTFWLLALVAASLHGWNVVARPLGVYGALWQALLWLLAWYGAVLVAFERGPFVRLTFVFAVMWIVVAAFAFLLPLHRELLETTTQHTAGVVRLIGFDPVVTTQYDGYRVLLLFPNRDFASIRITPACTGLGSIATIAGLVSATSAATWKRVVGSIAAGAFIYAANVVRTAFVAGATAGQWFGILAPYLRPVVAFENRTGLSFLLAERLLTKIAVVVVLVGTYLALARWIPELETFVSECFDVLAGDVDRLRGRRDE